MNAWNLPLRFYTPVSLVFRPGNIYLMEINNHLCRLSTVMPFANLIGEVCETSNCFHPELFTFACSLAELTSSVECH
jgi:hypothetical protein